MDEMDRFLERELRLLLNPIVGARPPRWRRRHQPELSILRATPEVPIVTPDLPTTHVIVMAEAQASPVLS
jgi:hypothetical protein